MKKLLCLSLFLLGITTFARGQNNTAILSEIQSYHEKLNGDFRNPEESPLTKEDFENFSGLDFFPINLKYRIEARFVRTPDQKPFKMPTTTNEFKIYEKYAEAHFKIDGKEMVLNIYQSHELRETEKYKNYLFLPFQDKTNGRNTYGGGRYLELWIPDGDEIILDFNKAYNPYCAYNFSYSCPVVPKENRLPVPIPVGVKDFKR